MLVEDVQYEYNSSIPAAGSMYVGSTYHTIQTHSRIDTDTDTLIKYSTVLYIHIFFDVCTVPYHIIRGVISIIHSSSSFIHHHHLFSSWWRQLSLSFYHRFSPFRLFVWHVSMKSEMRKNTNESVKFHSRFSKSKHASSIFWMMHDAWCMNNACI